MQRLGGLAIRLREDCRVVVWRKLNDVPKSQAGWLNYCRHVIRFHSHVRFRAARFSKNGSFFARTTMLVDDREASASFQNGGNIAREAQLIRNAMEGVHNENKINGPFHEVGNGRSITFDQLAVS